jgi:hypothetical protein
MDKLISSFALKPNLCHYSKERADLVGFRRGRGLTPMETDARLDELTGWAGDAAEDGGPDGGTAGRHSAPGAPHRYMPAPEHIGIAARAAEMEYEREDRVAARRGVEAHAQWMAGTDG